MSQFEALKRIERAKDRPTLDLPYLGLTSLPPEIAQLTQLEALNLSHNRLTSLPPQIAQFTQLKALDLSNNNLTSLPPQIGKLTQLRGLYISNNDLASVAPQIGKLTQLEALSFKNNELTSLPMEIAQLTELRKLYLKSNELASLPMEIVRLSQLETLDLSHNNLKVLPPEIAVFLLKIGVVKLDGNPLDQNQSVKILRSIEFPPKYKTSGMSILSYFGQIVEQKYPDLDVAVSIQQKGNTVSMTIETPEGSREKIEETLDEYGLVVTRQKALEDFLDDPLAVLELRSELRAAENRVATQHEIGLLKDKTIEKQDLRIDGLLNLIGEMVSKKTIQTLNVHTSNVATSEAHAQATIDFNFQANLGALMGKLRELAAELPEGDERQEVEKTAAALERIESESDPAEVRKSGPWSKLQRLVKKLSDGKDALRKTIDGVKDGREMAQEIGTLAGKIAQWIDTVAGAVG